MANELDAYKTEQQKLLEAQKARAQERAAINQQKLLKYLEQSSASKGYSVGMTESAKIAAANKYSQDVAAADAAYNQGMGELNNYLRTEQERLDDKAKAEQEKLEAKQKAEQDEIYGEVMTKIESGEFNTTAELSSYLNDKTIDTDGDGDPESSFLDLMSPAQRATVKGKLSYYQKKPEQIAADEAYNNQVVSETHEDGNISYKIADSMKKIKSGKVTWNDGDTGIFGWFNNAKDPGDNIEVKNEGADNEILNVEYGEKIEGDAKTTIFNEFKKELGREPKNNEVFGFDEKIYVYINGTLWTLTGRGGSTTTDDYSELYKIYFG